MNEYINPEHHTRRVILTYEFEVTSEDPLVSLETQEIFSTEQGKKIDARLIKSHVEILDSTKEQESQP